MAGALGTVKDAVNTASLELGITQTAILTAVSSSDQDIVQLTSMLGATAGELLLEEPYEESIGDGYWIRGADGTMKTAPTQDDDVILFDHRLTINSIKFRFLQAKGLEFGEQMRDFTVRLNKLAARANAHVIDLDADEGRVQ